IGLSIEEPAFNRTTTWKALVAAKAWVSHYPKLVKWIGKLSIQNVQDGFVNVCRTRFAQTWHTFTHRLTWRYAY
ncbi:hypothetical protein, partial [Vibrio mediterranei]|uniref:hypothetical protein n=1 Tax=Vibrio mediterranei TaxID=689 RepID=UPI001C62B772